jgi:D-alanyl-D-alanine carboxypeptidase
MPSKERKMKKIYLVMAFSCALAMFVGTFAYGASHYSPLSVGGTHIDGSVVNPLSGSTATPATISTARSGSGGNTCDSLLVLVDKSHGLPANYVPASLISLHDYGIPVNNYSIRARYILVRDLQDLIATGEAAGHYLVVASAYRSYAEQTSIFSSYVQDYGLEEANTFSARPGQSQHQLGTAIDFTTAEMGYGLSQTFGSTPTGQWLLANAYKYGFYLSYPQGQESVTGYRYEPWHFRYLGRQNASELQQSGLIMQTYLEERNIPPHC